MTRKIFLNAGLPLLLVASLAFSQTVWQKYEGNPVLSPTESWEYGFGVIAPNVLKIENSYKMWYTGLGGNSQIGHATSADGIHWTKSATNPILSIGLPSDFDSQQISYCTVLFHNNQFWMWYSGNNGTNWQIGLATSQDGINWTKNSNNPVLRIGSSGQWDLTNVYAPIVIFDGRLFRMWYNGSGPGFQLAIGYAVSADGIHWEKPLNNPVLTAIPGTWESQIVGTAAMLFLNDTFHLWYGGNNQVRTSLGYATSKDGVQWQRHQGNPVIAAGQSNAWDGTTLGGASVLFEKNVYKMWYSGRSDEIWKIGYAVSTPAIPAERLVFLPRVYGLPGDTINVTLYADPISGISGGDVAISFDPNVLAVANVETTDFTKHFLVAANLDTPGVARISLAGAQAAAGDLGGLITLRMTVIPSLPDSVVSRPLKLQVASFYDQNGQLLHTTKRDGEFVIGRPGGDVNGDGLINAADAILTLRISAGLLQPTPAQAAEADVDGNGHIESFDASCILLRAVGLSCPSLENSPHTATLTVLPFSANAGNQTETTITVDGIDKLLSGDMTLRYETAILEITEIRPSDGMSGVAFVANLNTNGQARISFAATNAIPTKTVAVVRLRAKANVNEKNLRSIEGIFFDTQGRRWNSFVTGVHSPEESALPSKFHLGQNYPNPFYRHYSAVFSLTQIRYSLPQGAHVKLAIYDLYGRRVRVLEDAEKAAGDYKQTWDGTDENKRPVASGVYVYRLQVGQNVLSRKLLLL